MEILTMFPVVFYTYILNEVTFINLPFQLTFMFLPHPQLLILDVVRCGFHSLFSFDVLLPFFLESSHRLFHLRLHNILMEYLIESVLVLVDFLYVSALSLVAPSHVSWRESADLFPVLILHLLSCKLLLKELVVFFLEQLLGSLLC
jgi:hypothetical protein